MERHRRNSALPTAALKVPDDITAAVRDKQLHDDFQTAELINRGTPTVPITTGGQGGMNRTFLAAISQNGSGVTIRSRDLRQLPSRYDGVRLKHTSQKLRGL